MFVLDGTPSPLKSQARMARFFRFSGIDTSTSNVAEEGVSKERNSAFKKCVSDCVVSSFFSSLLFANLFVIYVN